MSANVPRVADVARKGYRINCDKKVSPRAPCVNGVNVSLFENLFIIFLINFIIGKPNNAMNEQLTACYAQSR